MKKFCNKVINIMKELAARWNDTSPYLFKLIRWFLTVVGTISGAILAMKATGISMPAIFDVIGDRAILIGAATAFIVAKLPVDTDKAKQSTLNKIDENKPE